MMTDHRGIIRKRWKGNGLGGGARVSLALLGMVFLPVVACDSLLDVDIPGSVDREDLNNPALAETLAASAQGDFGCAFKAFIIFTALWADEFESSGARNRNNAVASRLATVELYGDDVACGGRAQSTRGGELWAPVHIARVQGERGAEIIATHSDEDVPNKSFLIGKSLAYAGYSYLLLAEVHCVLTFDQGPEVTREVGFNTAVTRFDEAMAGLSGATGGDAAEAADLMDFVRVGRARANLNLGNDSEVISYAQAVTLDFEMFVFSSEREERLLAAFAEDNQGAGGVITVHPRFRGLTVGGVPDPRVQTFDVGLGKCEDGIVPCWQNLKYTELDDDHRVASYEEAQLMIAEVEADRGNGAIAVGIINALRDRHADLSGVAFNVDPAVLSQNEIIELVREERRRELWLEGVRMGDKLRWNEPWDMGTNEAGVAYGPDTCLQLPDAETQSNPNFF